MTISGGTLIWCLNGLVSMGLIGSTKQFSVTPTMQRRLPFQITDQYG